MSKDVLDTKSAFLRERSTGLDLYLVDHGLVPRPILEPSPTDVMDDDVVGDDNDVQVVEDNDNDVVDNGDDVMDSGDDDAAAMVVDSDTTHLPNEATAISPYTIQYVDLTVLQSKKMLRVPRLMLFRNERGLP